MSVKILTPSICQTLIYLSSKNRKGYCFPSQNKILELLERFYDVAIHRRTLNRYLRYMEDEGYFKRVRRITRDEDGRYHFKSTLYIIKKKIYRMALRFGALINKEPYWKGIGRSDTGKQPGLVPGNGYIRNGFRNGIKKIIKAIKDT